MRTEPRKTTTTDDWGDIPDELELAWEADRMERWEEDLEYAQQRTAQLYRLVHGPLHDRLVEEVEEAAWENRELLAGLLANRTYDVGQMCRFVETGINGQDGFVGALPVRRKLHLPDLSCIPVDRVQALLAGMTADRIADAVVRALSPDRRLQILQDSGSTALVRRRIADWGYDLEPPKWVPGMRDHPDWRVRVAVVQAWAGRCPHLLLASLRDPSPVVRVALTECALDVHLLEKLATDPDDEVRLAAARRICEVLATPGVAQEQLAQDQSRRAAAAEALKYARPAWSTPSGGVARRD